MPALIDGSIIRCTCGCRDASDVRSRERHADHAIAADGEWFESDTRGLSINEHVQLGMSSSEDRGRLSEDYTTKVKTDILQMWKLLPRRNDDLFHPFFKKIAEGMELFWVYRPVIKHFPKGASDWFQRDRSVAGELVLIRDTLIPMLEDAERLGAADTGRLAFDPYARGRLREFKEFVEGYWKANNTSAPAHVDPDQRGMMTEMVKMEPLTCGAERDMQTMLSLLQAGAADGGAENGGAVDGSKAAYIPFANTRAYWAGSPSAAVVEKFNTLKNYVTNMPVKLLFFDQIQITAWTEIRAIVNTDDILTTLKDQLVAVQNKLTQNFADRKKDDGTLFNMKFKRLRQLVQECIQACEPKKTIFSWNRGMDVLLARLQACSENTQL